MPHIAAQKRDANTRTTSVGSLFRRVFTWPALFRPLPVTDQQPDTPVSIVNTRFRSYAAIGTAVGTTLDFDVRNVSDKPIHSFHLSYSSQIQADTGSGTWQPLSPLQPGESAPVSLGIQGKERIVIRVTRVRFADGAIWLCDEEKTSGRYDGF
jgi:hypothetical protein